MKLMERTASAIMVRAGHEYPHERTSALPAVERSDMRVFEM